MKYKIDGDILRNFVLHILKYRLYREAEILLCHLRFRVTNVGITKRLTKLNVKGLFFVTLHIRILKFKFIHKELACEVLFLLYLFIFISHE